MDEILKRISDFIECDGCTFNAFARKADIDPANFSRMMSGKQTITDRTLRKIAESHGVSFNWLKYGKGPMMDPDREDGKDGCAAHVRMVPHIPLGASAGSLDVVVGSVSSADCPLHPASAAVSYHDFTIAIFGDSMEPTLNGGDVVACRLINRGAFIQNSHIYVLDTEQGVIVKRVVDGGEYLECSSDNPAYPSFKVPKNEVYRMARVVGLTRAL